MSYVKLSVMCEAERSIGNRDAFDPKCCSLAARNAELVPVIKFQFFLSLSLYPALMFELLLGPVLWRPETTAG